MTTLVLLGLAIMCFMKGRILLGVLGLFVPAFALIGAVRLGQPNSPWARHRYSERRLARAQARFASHRRLARWRHSITNVVTGSLSHRDRDHDER